LRGPKPRRRADCQTLEQFPQTSASKRVTTLLPRTCRGIHNPIAKSIPWLPFLALAGPTAMPDWAAVTRWAANFSRLILSMGISLSQIFAQVLDLPRQLRTRWVWSGFSSSVSQNRYEDPGLINLDRPVWAKPHNEILRKNRLMELHPL